MPWVFLRGMSSADRISERFAEFRCVTSQSLEQSVGLTQVNTAVNEMDQVTQKNAAMVEEANAASATLAGDSGRLRSFLSAFHLPGVETSPRVGQPSRSGENISVLTPSSGRATTAAQAIARWEEL